MYADGSNRNSPSDLSVIPGWAQPRCCCLATVDYRDYSVVKHVCGRKWPPGSPPAGVRNEWPAQPRGHLECLTAGKTLSSAPSRRRRPCRGNGYPPIIPVAGSLLWERKGRLGGPVAVLIGGADRVEGGYGDSAKRRGPQNRDLLRGCPRQVVYRAPKGPIGGALRAIVGRSEGPGMRVFVRKRLTSDGKKFPLRLTIGKTVVYCRGCDVLRGDVTVGRIALSENSAWPRERGMS